MKTIQIPTTSNPFIVSINNHVYTYRAGSTVEVPDEVAAAIEDALELEPKHKRYLSRLGQLAEGSITELTISDLDGAEKIAKRAFEHCQSIKYVELPNCITSILQLRVYQSSDNRQWCKADCYLCVLRLHRTCKSGST